MRKKKLIISVVAGLAVSVGIAAIAQAVVTSQTITATSAKVKQDKKTPGAGDINVVIDTFETPPTTAAITAQHTNVDFDRDYVFDPGKLPQCTAATLAGKTTTAAIAACPGAVVGTGAAVLCSAAAGCTNPGISVPVTVTAFNGAPIGGNPVLYLHTKPNGIAEANPPLILEGQLIPSPLGKPYGKRLSVEVPDTSSTNLHLTKFQTNVGVLKNGLTKKVKGPKNPNTGKRKTKKVVQYYIMSKCSDKTWDFRSETQFRGGGAQQTDTTTLACQQKKVKKKKK